jgi:DNA-binding CsgD family transcriptional regulator
MSECIHCGAVDDEAGGIVVGLSGELNENVCNICRADQLSDRTTLSRREAEVAALKQLIGASHERIAEILGIAKSTVDEYSRRLNLKAHEAAVTSNELSEHV